VSRRRIHEIAFVPPRGVRPASIRGMNRWAASAIGGFLATLPMTAVMDAGHFLHPRDRLEFLPPRTLTARTLRVLGLAHRVGHEETDALALVLHYLYGGGTGAAYPLLDRVPARPVVRGMILGLLVWSGSYLGWVPAAGLMEPATRHRPERNLIMIAAHLVWGAATAAIAERLGGPTRGEGMLLRTPRARQTSRAAARL
jgi:hypothetical protein